MKVLRLQAQNVLGISEIDWDFEGHSLWLVGGRNGQGKTSAIRALTMALCGRSGMNDYPEIPLKDGEREGVVTVELSGSEELHEDSKLTAELKFIRKRSGSVQEQFRLYDSSGEDAPEPRTLLKRLYKSKGFDPLAFEKMPAKEQRRVLLEVLGIDLSADEEYRKELYEERKAVNRQAKQAEARIKGMDRPRDAPKEPVDTSELSRKLTEARKNNEEIRKLEDSAQRAAGVAEAKRNEAQELLRRAKELQVEADRLTGEAKVLDEELQNRLPADEDAIIKDISEAAEKNAKFEKLKAFQEAAREADALKQESNNLTDKIAEIDQKQKDALAAAECPFDGLSVDDDGVLINGVPFAQCSQSERIRASLEIGMLMHPDLRLLICEDGSALDLDSLKLVGDVAKEKDYLVLVELVTRSNDDEGICTVVIEGGRELEREDENSRPGGARAEKPKRAHKKAAQSVEVVGSAEGSADASGAS